MALLGNPIMPHILILDGLRGRLFRLVFGRSFKAFGRGSIVVAPAAIEGAANIAIGADVTVARGGTLAAVPHTSAPSCELRIGDGCQIGRFNHIYATRSVVLGTKVLTASGVYISDNRHGFDATDQAVIDQPIVQLADTSIGDGSWIGHGACIFGVRVGRNCVIGANAVVTRDLPDYSVAVGVPARIIRRFDPVAQAWRATDPSGEFLADAASS